MAKLRRAKKIPTWRLFPVLFFLSVSSAPGGEEAPPPAAATETPKTVPEAPKGESKAVPHLSGGVGVEQQETMRKQAGAYNVRLAFALKSREYVAEVAVSISDKNGNEILTAVSDGPWFFVQLPPDVYTIKCTFRGETKEIRDLRVPKDGQLSRTVLWDPGPKKSET